MTIRILLVDDHAIIRDAVRTLLQRQDEFAVIGETDNGRDAVRMAKELKPNAVVMDIGMRDLNGIEATRQIVQDSPATRVVILSMHSSRQSVSEALRAGASSYVLKEAALEEVETAIRNVVHGRTYLSQGIAHVVVDDYVRSLSGATRGAVGSRGRPLSPREREVLQLTGEGCTTKETASRLGLSIKTVETHRRQIMEKTGIYSLAGLIKYAIREGLASLED